MALEDEDREAAEAGNGAPRVTLESMEAKIESVDYQLHYGLLTIAVVRMKNGFMITGSSAPASPENFNAEYGQKLAYQKCISQLWLLEGYLLREQLSQQ